MNKQEIKAYGAVRSVVVADLLPCETYTVTGVGGPE